MMFELKDYQAAALDAFGRWLEALEEASQEAERGIAALEKDGFRIPGDLRNYPKTAWETLKSAGSIARTAGDYVSRTDGAGQPVSHACLKIPTGGGKTLLAAAALERLGRQSGLTLWITPTRAIYEQTGAALKDRGHPCRLMLERASGGRVKLLEKDDPFTAADAAHYLCVMLLMLPAANRRKGREFLRMFRDSGRYPSFFPDGDDILGEARLLNEYPKLDRVSREGPVKHSLFNVFKMLRPVVVLDEAHKAYGKRREAGEEFARAVSRLDPRLVVELSATPNRGVSNLLVDIGGARLKAEEMIKLPVQVEAFSNTAWTDTLAAAHGELERLDAAAWKLQADEGRYIRPVAVVRVERTGKGQRDGRRVHAEDVRDRLVRNLGVPPEAVAVKSAERDELAGVDLLSPYCPVRWVVTRAALMEGWDCPFAYLLVMLDNTTARRALTQLVGRVMRQPHARRTGREALDRCYVYCWNTAVGDAVSHVKEGLEEEGLTGLGGEVFAGPGGEKRPVAAARRAPFRDREIFLPLVLHCNGRQWRELDYLRDILPDIDWDAIDAPDPAESLAEAPVRQSRLVDIDEAPQVWRSDEEPEIDKGFKLLWFVRRLADIVPNAWQAAWIVKRFRAKLYAQGETDEAIYDRRGFLAAQLRRHVEKALEEQAEAVFMAKLRKREIRFDLQCGRPAFRMAQSYEIAVPEDAGPMTRKDGHSPLQLSLFEPVFRHQFDSELERRFARYLDEHRALQWWHRIAARQGGDYYLRGWKQNRIWPDFVGIAGRENGRGHLLIYETKGAHLDGSDAAYKQRVLKALKGAFECGSMTVRDGPAKGVFKLVFDEAEFQAALAGLGG